MIRIHLLLLCFVFQVSASEPLIRAKIINNNTIYFHLSAEFTKKYVKEPFYLTYPQAINLHNLPPTIVDIPLITNVIAVIWFSGKEYTIDEMDEDLYYSLIKIKAFFKRFFYNTPWEGELIPHHLVKNTLPTTKSQSAALFTAGLDSTTTVFRHLNENPILITFNDPHQTSIDFAKTYNLDFHTIYMNHDRCLKLTTLDKASCDITKWFWDTSMGLSWVGAATPLLYTLGIPTLYIPSGFTWRSFLFPDGQTLRQPASPLIDENLSPSGLQVFHDTFTMTRTDKVKFLSTYCSEKHIAKPKLIVCNEHTKEDCSYSHCNRCFKCLATMLDILAIGDDMQEYGFTLSEQEFVAQFQDYVANLKMRRGGTYATFLDTQRYLKQCVEALPQARREFYEWFMSLDLWGMVDEPVTRPLRASAFDWRDYRDLYLGVEGFVDVQ